MTALRSRLDARLHEERERLRVRRHLFHVLRELRAVPRADARRRATLDELAHYAVLGRFPRNSTVRGRAPVFRDERGHMCAVAHLAEASGRGDMVDAVHAVDNHARVADVRGGALVEWLPHAGLTQAEAARIQPTYDDGSFGEGPSPSSGDPTLALVSLAAALVANGAIVLAFWLAARGRLAANRARVAGLTLALLVTLGSIAAMRAAEDAAPDHQRPLIAGAWAMLAIGSVCLVGGSRWLARRGASIDHG